MRLPRGASRRGAENNQASLEIVAVVPQFVLAVGLPLDGTVTMDLQARFVADQTDKLEALVAPFRGRLRSARRY